MRETLGSIGDYMYRVYALSEFGASCVGGEHLVGMGGVGGIGVVMEFHVCELLVER